MKTFLSGLALAGLLVLAPGARATINFQIDFDLFPSGALADLSAPAGLSFHNAAWRAQLDSDGLEIAGSERWMIDAAADADAPITADNPDVFGFGAAPSGPNALNALFGPVFIRFAQPFRLDAFSATLDLSPYGDLGWSSIWFLHGSGVVDRLDFDATIPGETIDWNGSEAVTGMVLQGGGFYDDLAFRGQPVPEPATWGLIGAGACAMLILFRRRFRPETGA